ncbi:MAG: Crp/Fnr family transcriptional regulator, partial [Ferruginibacter sp.]
LNAVDGRLKKIDLLKKEFSPGLEGLHDLMKTMPGKDGMKFLTEGRNINKYKKKQAIYTEANYPNSLFFILKGKVKTYKANDAGKELVTELYNTGDFLGHVALLEGTVYNDTAEALEDSELAVIPKEDFDELVNMDPEVSKQFMRLLAKNIAAKENKLIGIAYNSLRKKVADALILLQKKYQQKKGDGFSIDISRESLATIAGTATESLIRTLGEFRNEKLIEIKGGDIFILDQKKLENLVN